MASRPYLALFLSLFALFATSFASAESAPCPYSFTADSKIVLANGYAASFASFNENSLFDRLVTGLRETRGYTLADEQNFLAPEYTIYYAIEADGSGRKIKPAVTLIYNTLDGNRSRMIMKVKRIWKESERVKKLEDLVDSVVKRVPACPTWVEPSSR